MLIVGEFHHVPSLRERGVRSQETVEFTSQNVRGLAPELVLDQGFASRMTDQQIILRPLERIEWALIADDCTQRIPVTILHKVERVAAQRFEGGDGLVSDCLLY